MPSAGGKSTTVSTQELSKEQRQLLKGVIPVAQDYINTPLQLYPGSVIPGLNPLQRQGRQQMLDAGTRFIEPLTERSINTAQGIQQQGRDLARAGSNQALSGVTNLQQAGRTGASGLRGLLGDYATQRGSRDFLASGALLDPRTNPVLAAQSRAAIRPIQNSLMREVLPGIRSNFVGGNSFGSSRQGIAEGLAISDFSKQASDITTNLQANNFNRGLEAMLGTTQAGTQAATSAAGQGLQAGGYGTAVGGQLAGTGFRSAMDAVNSAPDLARLSYLPGMTREAIGSSNRQLTGARLQEEKNNFMTQQMLPFLQAQDVAGLAMGLGGGSAVTQSNQSGSFDPFGTAGGLGMLMMALGGMGILPFSDVRVKRNIELVSKGNRFNWYKYNYIWDVWDEPPRLGMLAHEVEAIEPSAVHVDESGYKHIDYNALLGDN